MVATVDRANNTNVEIRTTGASTGAPRASIVRDPVQFTRMREEWSALLDKSAESVFNSWEWLYSWYRRLAPERDLFIITARDDTGRLIGIMPLAVENRRVLGRTVRRLTFLGESQVCSEYLDIIAAPERKAEMTRLFAAELAKRQSEWDVLDLGDLNGQSDTSAIFQAQYAGANYAVEPSHGESCHVLTFPPDEQFEQFLQNSGRRRNYSQRLKWLQAQPGFSIERETDPAKLAVAFSEFLRLHAMRWAGEGGSEGITGPQLEAFHRDATELLAEVGKFYLFTLKVHDKAVAAGYCLQQGDRIYYYQAGRDPEWNNRSVGLVLLVEMFRYALSAGIKSYDFLRGQEGYKAEWGNTTRSTLQLRIYPRSGSGRLLGQEEQLARRVRGAGKRILPTQLADKARHILGAKD